MDHCSSFGGIAMNLNEYVDQMLFTTTKMVFYNFGHVTICAIIFWIF